MHKAAKMGLWLRRLLKGMAGIGFMERLKKLVVAGLVLLIGLFALTSCNKAIRTQSSSRTSETTQISRGPLEVTKITYLVYWGGLNKVEMYVFTPDLKVEKYSIYPEGDKTYDYLAGELPSDDLYDITEFEISDLDWSNMVNVLTRVNFMELEEDMSTKDIVDDGASHFIMVETTNAVNISGGYVAGYDDDPDSRRFAEAREMIENAINNR